MTLKGLKIKLGKALVDNSIRKVNYTNTRQNVRSLVNSGYDFKNDCLVWIDKEQNKVRTLEQLYKMEDVLMNAGLGYHCSLDEKELCIWLSEESGE